MLILRQKLYNDISGIWKLLILLSIPSSLKNLNIDILNHVSLTSSLLLDISECFGSILEPQLRALAGSPLIQIVGIQFWNGQSKTLWVAKILATTGGGSPVAPGSKIPVSPKLIELTLTSDWRLPGYQAKIKK